MSFKKTTRLTAAISIMLILVLCFGATAAGAYTNPIRQNVNGSIKIDANKSTTNVADNPSLTLNIRSAAVTLETATDNKISAKYNSSVYNTKISNQGNTWNVDISCKTRKNTNTETIKLYIPDVNYNNITMNVDSAYLTNSIIKSGNIIGNFNTSSVLLTLPKGFSGSVDATATSGYFKLISKDDFSNTNTTIIDDGEIGEIYTPKDFIKNGDTITFTNGTQSNVIKVTRKGMGVIGIYSSNYSDSVDIPSESQNEWENSWQGHWRNSWQKNWWSTSPLILFRTHRSIP